MTRRTIAGLGAVAAVGVLLWRLRPDAAQREAPVDEPAVITRLAAWSPAPPNGALTRLSAYAWAAPLTAAGLLVGAVSNSAPRLHDGALLFAHAGGLAGWMLRWRRFKAATLGHVIIALDEPSEELLVHELTHVRQAERWGPLFAPLYLAGLVRYGYRYNPFERAAYRAGTTFRAARGAGAGRQAG
jgi:hypothetical protein